MEHDNTNKNTHDNTNKNKFQPMSASTAQKKAVQSKKITDQFLATLVVYENRIKELEDEVKQLKEEKKTNSDLIDSVKSFYQEIKPRMSP
eukprot:CAMPEP_0202710570 /NCGR_PEP_ID=MMETSP1385-20130828/22535_1 /ASSEMBLY_ACC=CAM_ASM_000861 /TAXON_ID=933848 /ORGANISM="Elphidium margaritaceum" /LENGTH=89 /DNA_ID=CAMNT_0049370139 /DNA_START=17 /DNA_END=282 /DNA_ORIENTATION=+